MARVSATVPPQATKLRHPGAFLGTGCLRTKWLPQEVLSERVKNELSPSRHIAGK